MQQHSAISSGGGNQRITEKYFDQLQHAAKDKALPARLCFCGGLLRGNRYGVYVDSSRANTIGGDAEAARNVIGVAPSPAGTPASRACAIE